MGNVIVHDALRALKIKVFADGANLEGILSLAEDPLIQGYTTNPTLMRKAGVTDYTAFAKDVLARIREEPVSFEVFADAFDEMEGQALEIASWGPNVYVKIPVTNTRGESAAPLIERLSAAGVKLNVTALMTRAQVEAVAEALHPETAAVVSVFAGRVADTGRDPVPLMRECLDALRGRPNAELLWASPRELLNIFQADAIGCHIITVTSDLLNKLGSVGYDLDAFSLDTVKMFHRDASAAGYSIPHQERIVV
jgi:transaldolase